MATPSTLITTETEEGRRNILDRFRIFGVREDGTEEELAFDLGLSPESAIESAWDIALKRTWAKVSPEGGNWPKAKLVEVNGNYHRMTVHVTREDYMADYRRMMDAVRGRIARHQHETANVQPESIFADDEEFT